MLSVSGVTQPSSSSSSSSLIEIPKSRTRRRTRKMRTIFISYDDFSPVTAKLHTALLVE